MAEPLPADVALIWQIVVDGELAGHGADTIARTILAALKDEKRLLPAGMIEISHYHDYRWRHLGTGEVQEALHARHSPDGWVQDRRRGVRARGEWEPIEC